MRVHLPVTRARRLRAEQLAGIGSRCRGSNPIQASAARPGSRQSLEASIVCGRYPLSAKETRRHDVWRRAGRRGGKARDDGHAASFQRR